MLKQNFTMPGGDRSGISITLPSGNALYVLVALLMAGTLTCIAAALAVLFGAALLLNLLVSALVELVSHVALVYTQADSITKVVIWLVMFLLIVKVAPLVARKVKR